MVNLLRIEESLSAAYLRLAGVTVEHQHWHKVLERYDRPHTFFYCDPPYWQTEGYGVPFEFDQYLLMAEFMRNCSGKVMVSINDHPDIREAFAGHWIADLDITYSVGNARSSERKATGELVICNWNPDQMGTLF